MNPINFVARLLQAVSRIVVDGKAGTIIVRQLAFENANSACQAAIRPWRKTGTLEDYIRICAEIGPSYIQGVTLAAALKGISPQELQNQLTRRQRNSKKGGLRLVFSVDERGILRPSALK